jgi:hypothetical protein
VVPHVTVDVTELQVQVIQFAGHAVHVVPVDTNDILHVRISEDPKN